MYLVCSWLQWGPGLGVGLGGLSVCPPVGEALSTVVTPKQLGDNPDWSHLQNFEQIKSQLKLLSLSAFIKGMEGGWECHSVGGVLT